MFLTNILKADIVNEVLFKIIGILWMQQTRVGLISAPPMFEHLMHRCLGYFNFDESKLYIILTHFTKDYTGYRC